MAQYLIIPRLKIHNANAMSSAYTLGFPAMTAWLGAMHALQRRIQSHSEFANVSMQKIAVSCHACDVQIYKGHSDYKYSIIGTANPLKRSKKTGEYERPSFIEEARCHLNVTLLLEIEGIDDINEDEFKTLVCQELSCMKIAGGDIENDLLIEKDPSKMNLDIIYPDADGNIDIKKIKKIKRWLMPGYVLVQRDDLMHRTSGADALDNVLDSMKIICTRKHDDKENTDSWHREKKVKDGWLVPIVVGFKDLVGAAQVAEQRTQAYEHHFVEPVLTVGEFIMPYHCESLEEMLWQYHYDKDQGYYLCINGNINK